MRLIDADAEIEEIDEEIKRIKERIATWDKRKKENDAGRFDADYKIMEQMSNLADCVREKRMLESYETAFDIEKIINELENKSGLYKTLIEYEHKCGTIVDAIKAEKALEILNYVIKLIKDERDNNYQI